MNAPLDPLDAAMNASPNPEFNHADDERRSSNERFELLSAYMDGEVTAEERRLVESWLANEPKVQQMHQRLMALQSGFEHLPGPAERSPRIEQTIDQVFEKIEKRSRWRVIVGGGLAAAAGLVAAVVSINSLVNGPSAQFAESPAERQEQVATSPSSENMTAGLLVSLDNPNPAISPQRTKSANSTAVQSEEW
jgi:anti-sigma factor RsiW